MLSGIKENGCILLSNLFTFSIFVTYSFAMFGANKPFPTFKDIIFIGVVFSLIPWVGLAVVSTRYGEITASYKASRKEVFYKCCKISACGFVLVALSILIVLGSMIKNSSESGDYGLSSLIFYISIVISIFYFFYTAYKLKHNK